MANFPGDEEWCDFSFQLVKSFKVIFFFKSIDVINQIINLKRKIFN